MNIAYRLLFGFALPVLLGVSFLGYVVFRAKAARTSIATFCSSVELSDSSETVLERARSSNLSVHEFPPRDGKGTILVEDGVLLARHFCNVEYEQGRVVSKKTSFGD